MTLPSCSRTPRPSEPLIAEQRELSDLLDNIRLGPRVCDGRSGLRRGRCFGLAIPELESEVREELLGQPDGLIATRQMRYSQRPSKKPLASIGSEGCFSTT